MSTKKTAYDPNRPITADNWPEGLRMPPKRKQPDRPKQEAPATTAGSSPWDFGDLN